MRRGVMQGALGLLIAASAGCASRAHDVPGGEMHAGLPFEGSWAVPWCSKTDPQLDCGGFAITLFQEGSRVCGDFTGALVNLRQIDEGEISGTATGDVAMLAVKSGRNDEVLRIRATRIGRDIEWKQIAVIEEGYSDASIIALDDILAPAAHARQRIHETCGMDMR